MAKNYQDYCREAVERDPKTYGHCFNKDGSRKKPPNMASVYKKKVPKDVPFNELRKKKKDGYKPAPPKPKKPEIEIIGTEIRLKGRKLNLATLPMPKNPSRKEYNRIWMYNNRVKAKIKELKEKYGITATL